MTDASDGTVAAIIDLLIERPRSIDELVAALARRFPKGNVEHMAVTARTQVHRLRATAHRHAGEPIRYAAPFPAITKFSGPDSWLSNFHPVRVQYAGAIYPTVENAYQAAKMGDPGARAPMTACPPAVARRLGRTFFIRNDWEDIRLAVMEQLLRQKFAEPALRKRLYRTRGRRLIETNFWHDRFWGVCRGTGCNHLGELIMKIREDVVRIARHP